MVYVLTALAFLGGVLIGWLVSRPRLAALLGRVEIAEQLVTDAKNTVRILETQNDRLREQLEQERLESARLQTRMEEAQAALREQKSFLDEARLRLGESFGALSAQSLKANNEVFLQLACKTLEGFIEQSRGELGKKEEAIDKLIRPLHDALARYEGQVREMENTRHSAYGSLKTYLEELNQSNLRLQEETRLLSSALRRPQIKGRWGVITLRRVVEVSGMSEHCDFVEQPSYSHEEGRRRPDMVVNLPEGRSIVVDSKAPLDSYLEAFGTADEAARNTLLKRHAQNVRAHMQMLGSKDYWKQFANSPDFVVLFLPGESFFSAALEQDRTLIEDGMHYRVILATPTTLIALLRTVALGWQQQEVAMNAQMIWKTGYELSERLQVFSGHFARMRDGLQKASQNYNAALSSWESRVIPCATRLRNLGGAQQEQESQEIQHVETYLREPQGGFFDTSGN